MEKEFFIELESGEQINALSGSSKYQKCWQMANGAIYKQDEDIIQPGAKTRKSNEFHLIHNEKIVALENLIDELSGQPLLLGYYFQHDLIRLKKHFGNAIKFIGSKISMSDCLKIQKDFNLGKITVLAGHPLSVSLGLNLQERGSHICFFSQIQNYEADYQFIRRVYRQGVKNKSVFVHRIIAKNTVDEILIKASNRKHDVQKKFLDFVHEYKKRRLYQFLKEEKYNGK